MVIVAQAMYLLILITYTDDIVLIIRSAAFIPPALMAFEATLFTWRHGSRLARLVANLEATFPMSRDEQESANVRETFKNWKRLSWIVCRCYFMAIIVICLQNSSLALLGYYVNGEWVLILPRQHWYPFDTSSESLKAFVFIWECYGTMVTSRAAIAVGVFLGSVSIHICVQFDLLNHQFRELTPQGENTREDHDRLVTLVEKHKFLIDICDELGNVFRPTLLVNYVLCSVIIGCFGFLILNEPVLAQKFEYIFDFAAFMSYNSMFSLYGDSLMERVSSLVGDSQTRPYSIIILGCIYRVEEFPERFSRATGCRRTLSTSGICCS